jgi:hypothetical protein
MNFRLRGKLSVILMSLQPNAPYADRVEDNGRVLIYEGHDAPKLPGQPEPKSLDQPASGPNSKPTQNGLFYDAAQRYKNCAGPAELVKVYEKVRHGIWVYNGIFRLIDSWQETSDRRKVFKFRLEVYGPPESSLEPETGQTRIIPTDVKLAVWKRDHGKCVTCGSKTNLHFDHIIPYSRGGSSLVPENIQLLCAKHNLAKRAKIE